MGLTKQYATYKRYDDVSADYARYYQQNGHYPVIAPVETQAPESQNIANYRAVEERVSDVETAGFSMDETYSLAGYEEVQDFEFFFNSNPNGAAYTYAIYINGILLISDTGAADITLPYLEFEGKKINAGTTIRIVASYPHIIGNSTYEAGFRFSGYLI